jgi:hypothetical protein
MRQVEAETGGREMKPGPYRNASDDSSLADRIEEMAGLGILSHIDNSGQLDLDGQLSEEDKARIVAALRGASTVSK